MTTINFPFSVGEVATFKGSGRRFIIEKIIIRKDGVFYKSADSANIYTAAAFNVQDVNKDGVIDKKDISKAAKVLSEESQKKESKKSK